MSVHAGLVGLWRFNQGVSPQPDVSGFANNANVVSAIWTNDLVRGGVMEFDGNNDYIEAADSASLSITGNLTLACWLRLDATIGGGGNWRGFVAKGTGSNPASYQWWLNQGNAFPVLLRGNGTVAAIFGSTNVPPDNGITWTHMAVSMSGTTVVHYINGNPTVTGGINVARADNNGTLIIGNRHDFTIDMDGRLDDVAIFDEALSAAQIRTVMSNNFLAFGIPLEDISISKTASPTTFYLSETNALTYTLIITNSGTLDFSGCVVTDTLPAYVTFDSAAVSQGSANFTNSSVIWTVGVLTNNTSASMTIVVTNLTNSVVINRATVNRPPDDVNSNNNVSVTTNIIFNSPFDMADLTINKSDSPDPIYFGTNLLTYSITVTNLGPSNSVGTVIYDQLPPSLSFLPPTPFLNQVLHFPFATNETNVVVDNTGLGHSGTPTNVVPTASGYSGAAMTFSGDDSFIHVPHAPDLSFSNGQPITISAWVRQTNFAAPKVVVIKDRNAGLDNANYALRLDYVGGSALRMVFFYRGDTGNHIRRMSGDFVTINAWHHLAVTYTFGGGTNIQFYQNGAPVASTWINISLNGTEAPWTTNEALWVGADRSSSTNITGEFFGQIDDVRIYRRILTTNEIALLANTNRLRSDFNWQDLGGGLLKYDAGNMGASASTTVTFKASAISPGVVTNVAFVLSAQVDSNSADNVDAETTDVRLEADLGVTKGDAPDPSYVGGNLTYTIIVTNSGPTFASSVTVTDALPQGVTFNAGASTAGSLFTNGMVIYNLGTRQANSSTSLTIQVTVSATNAAAHITNIVTVASSTTDTNTPNNSASQVTTLLIPQADLLITKNDNIDPVFVGNALTYSVVVTNRGPDVAASTVVTDSLPQGVTFNAGGSTAGGTLSGTNVIYNVGNLAVNSSTSLTIQVIVSGTNTAAHITNRVSVATLATDTNMLDNTDTEVTALSEIANLSVIKTDSVDPLTAGSFVTYSVLVSNIGPSLAANVVVTDTPPASLTFMTNGSTPGLLYTNGIITYTVGNMPAGARTTLTIRAQSSSCASGIITNFASAATTTPETNLSNNSSSQTTSNSLLKITQGRYDFSYPFTGISINGQDNWISAGPIQPTPFGFDGSTAIRNTDHSTTLANRYNDSQFSIPTFNSNMTDAVIQFDATYMEALIPERKLGFYLRSEGGAYSMGTIMQANGLFITDTSSSDLDFRAVPGTFAPGEWIRLRLVIDFTAAGGNGSAVLYYRNLSDGETDFTAYVTNNNLNILGMGAAANPQLWTGLVARLDSFGPHIDNLQVSECDIGVAKFDSADPINAGSNLVYTLIVSNNGPMIATDVTLIDRLPTGIEFVSAITSDGSTTQDGCLVRCTLNDLAVGAAATVTITMVASSEGTITNRAVVQSRWYDPLQANNEVSITTDITPGADVRVSKTDSVDPVTAGDTLTYTITVTNAGTLSSSSIVVTDSLPAQVTFNIGGSPGWSESSGIATYDVGTLSSGSATSFVLQVDVNELALGILTNNIRVTHDTPDPVSSNNVDTELTAISSFADLEFDKTNLTSTMVAGAPFDYLLTVSNAGPNAATSVWVTDVLPAGLTFNSSGSSVECIEGGGIVTCSVASILSQAQHAFTVRVDVVSSMAAGIVTNSIDGISITPDPDTNNNVGIVATPITFSADVAVSKFDSPDPVNAGQLLTYTIVITNNGPSDATSVTVTDDFPSAVSPSGTYATNIGTLAAGSSVTLTIEVTVASSALNDLTNFVSVTSDVFDPETDNNNDSTITEVLELSDLALTKTDSPDPAIAGTNLTYSFTVTNSGPSDALGVVLHETLPSGIVNPGGFPMNLPNIPAGSSYSTSVTVTVLASTLGTITNTAYVTSTTPESQLNNNTSVVETTVNGSADLNIYKVSAPNPVKAGSNTTYTIFVINSGPSDAISVTVTDVLPAAVSPSGVFVTNIGTVAAGSSASFTIGVAVASSAPSTLTNVVYVSSITADPDATDNANTGLTEVVYSADKQITVTAAPEPVLAGQTVIYTWYVTNAGPSDAFGVSIANTFPSGVTPSGVYNTNVGTLVVGASFSASVTVTVHASTLGVLTNKAVVTGAFGDDVPNNNTSIVLTVVNSSADLSVSKSDSPDPMIAGSNLTYTITVTNAGPSDAISVTVTDVLPVAVSPSGTFVTNIGTIAAGSSTAITLEVAVASSASPITGLSNIVYVASETADPATGNNVASEVTEVNTLCDLALTKSGAPDPVTAGNMLTYSYVVTNSGPSDASGINLFDTFPSGVVDPGVFPMSLPAIAAGSSYTTSIVVTVNASTLGVLTNVAYVTSTTTDNDSGNNTSVVETVVNASANIGILKYDSDDPIMAGGNLSYTIIVTNAGPSDAISVTITDVLPSAVSPSGVYATNVGALAAGSSISITLDVIVASSAQGAITNTATASSPTADPDTGNNSVLQLTVIDTSADIRVLKIDTPDPVVAGGNLTYAIFVTNAGPSDAISVTVTDVLPAAVSPSGIYATNLGNMAAGSSASFTIQVTVASSAPGTLTNVVIAGSATADPNTTNNSSTALTEVVNSSDKQISKTATPSPATAGQSITYTWYVTNAGPSDTFGVTVTDTLPAGVTPSGVYVTNLGVLAAGASTSASLTVTVGPSIVGVLTNVAVVSGAYVDDVPNNNTAVVETVVSAEADITIAKTDSPDPVFAGALLQYTITVTNRGPSTAQPVTISDTLPSSVNFILATPTSNLLAHYNFATDLGSAVADASGLGHTGTVIGSTYDANGLIGGAMRFDGGDDRVEVPHTDDLSFTNGQPITITAWINPTNSTSFNVILSKGQSVGAAPTDIGNYRLSKTSDHRMHFAYNQPGGSLHSFATVPNMAPTNRWGHVAITYIYGSGTTAVFYIDGIRAASSAWVNGNGNAAPRTNATALMLGAVPNNAFFVEDFLGFIDEVRIYRSILTSNQIARLASVAPQESDPAWNAVTGSVVAAVIPAMAPNTSTSLLLVARVASSALGDITNTVVVSSSATDTNSADNTDTEITTIFGRADMGVSKSDTPDPVTAGSTLVYTIRITNSGPSDAISCIVTDTLPSVVSPSGFYVTNLGTIVAGGQAVRSITVTVHSSASGQITNTVTISSGTTDTNAANDTTVQVTTLNTSANLMVRKTDAPDPVIAGSNLVYTITVTNLGPSDAISCVVTDTLPAGVTPTGIVVSNLATIAAGSAKSFSITVAVDAATVGVITNRVTVNSITPDAVAGNNATTQPTVVNAVADLGIGKSDAPDPITTVNALTYTIYVTNYGPSVATSVTVNDTLPAGVTPSGAYITNLGTLAVGASTSAVIPVTVNGSTVGVITNSATISSFASDPNAANNTATTTTTIMDFDNDGNPNFNDPDDDNDGIPDFWEILYGLNPFDPADAAIDNDLDTFLNIHEYIADTIPTNVNSFHHIVSFSNALLRYITFPSSTGRVYDLDYSTNLLQPGWLPIITNLPGQPGITTIPDTNSAPFRIYRIGVELP